MSRGWGVESVSTSIAPGITKNDSSSTAPEAISQPINGCAAQHSGQLLMFEGKSCSHGRSFTMGVCGKCAQCSTKFAPILELCVEGSIYPEAAWVEPLLEHDPHVKDENPCYLFSFAKCPVA